jgi:integrase
MSRRSGQVGRIEKKGNSYRVRFRLDVPGSAKRIYKSVFIAPVNGPGSLTKPELQRRAKELVAESGANAEATLRNYEAVTLSPTFKQQAERWLEAIQARKRKPVKPHTVATWKSSLARLYEQIGDAPLSSVNNVLVRDHVVTKMASDDFSPKTISNDVGLVKMVVASVINEDGEPVYPVKWNSDFMDMPDIGDQRKPVFTEKEVTSIIAKADGEFAVLCALLAGTGLRVGEALALQVEDIGDQVVRVSKTLWNGKLQTPKTKNAYRDVDLHSSLTVVVAAFIDTRKTGFLFASPTRHISNTLRHSLHPILKSLGREVCGFHAFRRFRNTYLRKKRVPDGLIQFWMGHAAGSMTDNYDRVREDVEFRRFTAEQVGLGFTPPEARKPVAPSAPQVNPSTVTVSA